MAKLCDFPQNGLGLFICLVEMAGFEPASANPPLEDLHA